jgi:hypothetical protein
MAAPKTWAPWERVTADMLNIELKDQLNAALARITTLETGLTTAQSTLTSIQGVWTAYTPVLIAATTNPAYTAGAITGRYLRIGKTCIGHIDFTLAGFTQGSGLYKFSLPFTPAYDAVVGSGWLNDASTATKYAVVTRAYSNNLIADYTSAVGSGDLAQYIPDHAASPWYWTNGDQMHFNFNYETI